MTSREQNLVSFIRKEWNRDIPPAVESSAGDIAKKYDGAVVGILFYGSCLRTGEIEDKILDFYVIVDSYRKAYSSRMLAVANKLLPPNVFYHEIDVNGITVRSKYAVLSLSDLQFRSSKKCLNVSVWARFCQPCMLIAPRDDFAYNDISYSIAQSVTTMLSNLLALKPFVRESRDIWVDAFEQTYAAELRSERKGKGLEIYLLDQDRYDRLTPVALEAMGLDNMPLPQKHQPDRVIRLKPKVMWMLRRWNGKFVSFARLVKAAATFDGGIDYLAWKIRRHSGVEIEIKDWMRKWPVIAGISLFWKLRKKGAFK